MTISEQPPESSAHPSEGIELPSPGSDRFNPFQNEPDMFKVLLAVVAACVVAVLVKYAAF